VVECMPQQPEERSACVCHAAAATCSQVPFAQRRKYYSDECDAAQAPSSHAGCKHIHLLREARAGQGRCAMHAFLCSYRIKAPSWKPGFHAPRAWGQALNCRISGNVRCFKFERAGHARAKLVLLKAHTGAEIKHTQAHVCASTLCWYGPALFGLVLWPLQKPSPWLCLKLDQFQLVHGRLC